jgi:hypothetical protein
LRPLLPRLILLATLAVATALALVLHRPPAPRDEAAPPGEFSAMRALVHLRAIAAAPHPTGSEAHAKVHEHILQALRSHGLEPEVQAANVSVSSWARKVPGGVVKNIFAVLPGRERGPALLLASHYDSVAAGPGASDDGAAVAAMLEALRALRAGPALKNDIIFLFTDGEELGLVGAEAFVLQHPLAARVGAALNFEARGSRGPVFMFETSRENGWLIGELAAAAPHITASSLSGEVYRRMPNDTDFTVFRKRGVSGMNFAYIGGLRHYHTPGDNIENLDLGSLQHHGSYMVSLARRLGDVDLNQTRARDAVYFNLIGSVFVHYSSKWVFPLIIVAGAAFLGAVAYGAKRGALRLARAAAALGLLLATILGTALLVTAASLAVLALDPRTARFAVRGAYDNPAAMIALAALAAGIGSLVYIRAARRFSLAELSAGALSGWLLLAILMALTIPGGSYLFTWPLLFGSIGLWALVLAPRPGSIGIREAALLAIAAFPSLTLVVPTIHGLYTAMTVLLSGGVLTLVTLTVGLLAPQIALALGPARQDCLAASASSASSS